MNKKTRVFLSTRFKDKNEKQIQYAREYVKNWVHEKYKINLKDIVIVDNWDCTTFPNKVEPGLDHMYFISKAIEKMSTCTMFVYYRTYMFDIMPDGCQIEKLIWDKYSSDIYVYEEVIELD